MGTPLKSIGLSSLSPYQLPLWGYTPCWDTGIYQMLVVFWLVQINRTIIYDRGWTVRLLESRKRLNTIQSRFIHIHILIRRSSLNFGNRSLRKYGAGVSATSDELFSEADWDLEVVGSFSPSQENWQDTGGQLEEKIQLDRKKGWKKQAKKYKQSVNIQTLVLHWVAVLFLPLCIKHKGTHSFLKPSPILHGSTRPKNGMIGTLLPVSQ